MVAKSLLLDAGILFIAQGEKLQELVEPGRIGTNFSVPLGTVKLQVQAEDIDEAREILRIEEDKLGSQERVQELEHRLMGEVIWFAVFFLAGLILAYLVVPGTWDEGVRILIYAAASICSAFLGTTIRKSRGYDPVPEEKPVSEDEEPTQPSTDKKKYMLVVAILALSILFLFYHYGIDTERGRNKNFSTGSIKKMLEDYKKAITQNPNDATYQFLAGTAYLMLKSPREALLYLNRVIEIDPNQADYFYSRGSAHYQLADYDGAIRDYSKVIDLGPQRIRMTDAYHGRAASYYMNHHYWQAIKDFDKVIDLDPNRAQAYLYRGQSYERFIDDHQWAITDFSKAIELDPKNALAYALRGSAYGEAGRYDNAIKDFDRAIRITKEVISKASYLYCIPEVGFFEKTAYFLWSTLK